MAASTKSQWSDEVFGYLEQAYVGAADPVRSEQMAAYLRDQFDFFGIGAQPRKQMLSAAFKVAGPKPTEADLEHFARRCYAEPEREWHYSAVGALRRRVKTLTPHSVPLVYDMVVTHSWWDTIDEIASHIAGGLVSAYPELVEVMDEWAASDNMWVARTAILHQLRYKHETDVERLFGYCLARADEDDFFYRKAIGWALRQYSRTDPVAVREFCETNADKLSALSYKEGTRLLK